MDSIKEVLISFDTATKQWTITNSPNNEITIQLTDRILFRSKDGKEYNVIINGASDYFNTTNENYLFVVFPFNLTITHEANATIAAPGLLMELYVRLGDNVIKHNAPPKIIIHL